jgi:hypothetical protein
MAWYGAWIKTCFSWSRTNIMFRAGRSFEQIRCRLPSAVAIIAVNMMAGNQRILPMVLDEDGYFLPWNDFGIFRYLAISAIPIT